MDNVCQVFGEALERRALLSAVLKLRKNCVRKCGRNVGKRFAL
jgi:hypothetical protein